MMTHKHTQGRGGYILKKLNMLSKLIRKSEYMPQIPQMDPKSTLAPPQVTPKRVTLI